MTTLSKRLGGKLRAAIKASGLTQKAIGHQVGATKVTMQNYLNGRTVPDVITFARICRLCNITPNDLLGFDYSTSVKERLRKEFDKILSTL